MSAFDFDLIGIDGGATEAKAHHIEIQGAAEAPVFKLGESQSLRKYEKIGDFAPLPVPEQLKQRDENNLQLSAAEKEQAELYIEAVAQVVKDVCAGTGRNRRVLIGIGFPGLKTPDGRGINVILNGPRMPKFLDRLGEKLQEGGIELVQPIARLGSDADYCGIGEQFAEGGMFGDVNNAYYAGCGTGVADAMKINGKLVTFDSAKEWIQKAWQMNCPLGVTSEKVVSAKSMNMLFATFMGVEGDILVNAARWPQDEAIQGNALAKYVMNTVATILADLLFERLQTVACGRHAISWRGPNYIALKTDHPYRGTFLDRLIIGQRLGHVFCEDRYQDVFRRPLLEAFSALLHSRGNKELKGRYLKPNGQVVDGLVVGSRLRAAPAIGAGVAAYEAAFGVKK